MEKNPLVSICSITYNHAPYIRECLDGFLMQKTTFPFEIIIHDDCSTDGTDEIIREYAKKYPDIIKPIFETENQYSKGVRGMFTKYCYPQAEGKYIALCEGDDYWTDPLKLQKQVDFLEEHPDYSMVFTNAIEHWEGNSKQDKPVVDWAEGDISPVELYARWQAPTATILYRKEVIETKIYKDSVDIKKLPFSDIQIGIACGLHGKIFYMDECMTIYRRLLSGESLKISDDPWPHIRTRIQLSKIYGKEYIDVDKKYVALYFIRALKEPLKHFPNNIYVIFRLLWYTPVASFKELKWIFRSINSKYISN